MVKVGQEVSVKLTAYLDSKFVPAMEGRVSEVHDDYFILEEAFTSHLYKYIFTETTIL